MNAQAEIKLSTRSDKRTRVLMTATLFTSDGVARVRIRDISKIGAHVYADSRMATGGDAVLKKGAVFVAGRITWARGKDAGVNFYRELSAQELVHFFNLGAAADC